jgi:hypothetical protein
MEALLWRRYLSPWIWRFLSCGSIPTGSDSYASSVSPCEGPDDAGRDRKKEQATCRDGGIGIIAAKYVISHSNWPFLELRRGRQRDGKCQILPIHMMKALALKLCGGGTTGAMARIGSECGVVWCGRWEQTGQWKACWCSREAYKSAFVHTVDRTHEHGRLFSVLFSQGQGSSGFAAHQNCEPSRLGLAREPS